MTSEHDLAAEVQRLQARQLALEHRLAQLEAKQSLPPGPALRLPWAQRRATPASVAETEALTQQAARQARTLENLMGLQGFSWLGILALISGLAMFVRYAYLEGWLGPWATLLAGLLLATGLIVAGEYTSRLERYRTWAHSLMGGGVALLYFLAYAAYHFSYFQKVTHLNALTDTLLLIAVVVLGMVLALRRQSQNLASRAFVLGFATSFFSQDFALLTLSYNFLLSLGLLAVAARAGWIQLALMGVAGSWGLHGLWAYHNPEQALSIQGLALVYLVLYTLLYAVLRGAEKPVNPWLQLLASLNLMGYGVLTAMNHTSLTAPLRLGLHGTLTLLVLGGFCWGLKYSRWRLPTWLQGLLLSQAVFWFYGAIHAQAGLLFWLLSLSLALAGLGRLLQRQAQPAGLVDALALTLLLRAAFVAFDKPWLQLALALLLLAFCLLTRWLAYAHRLALMVLSVVTPWLLFQIYADQLRNLGFLFSVDTLVLVLLWLAMLTLSPQVHRSWVHVLTWPVTLLSACWLFVILPLPAISPAWAGCGALLSASGFALSRPVLRYQGLALLLAAGSKIYFWDLRDLSLGYRILSLLVLGVLLLAVAWLYTRFQSPPGKQKTQT
ncbi:MAG: DUF2339 domain-containing protein [Candidatus Sericytochromatia bacterium]|nr:DUF2339 domain-containing protein [Candidatus Sericytochromatia bacterium]